MNAVERVKNNFDEKCSDSSKEYDRGYYNALYDVQKELDKEVCCNYESSLKAKHECEIEELKKEIDKLINLKHHYEDVTNDLRNEKNELFRELCICKGKLEIVELIFGGRR